MFWSGDSQAVSSILSDILINTISYFDYDEVFYHAFIVGILSTYSSSGFTVVSNRESGLGRPDIILYDLVKKRACCLEVKVADNQSNLSKKAEEALEQISDKKYDIELRKFSSIIGHWGLAFFQKTCLASYKNV